MPFHATSFPQRPVTLLGAEAMPFTMKNAASATPAKRASEGASSEESPAKRAAPLYANLTLMDAPKRQVAQRLPPTGPVVVAIYKVSM